MVSIELFLGLLLTAIVVVVVAGRLRIPYTIGLVVLGLLLGIAATVSGRGWIPSSVSGLFSPSLFFDILLPPIIFEAALNVRFVHLRRHLGLVLFLVSVGVVFTTVFTGLVVGYLAGLPILAALLLGAILSPTDPIAVVDLFRRLKVPEELSTIVQSESLLNDAVGVMLFVVLLGFATTGTADLGVASIQFVWLTLGGIAVGLLAAGGVYLLHRRVNDASVETSISVVAAYGSFLVATDIGASGIIATAIAGLAVGTVVAPRAIEPEVRSALSVFWGVVVYIANSVIFLSVGLLIAVYRLFENLPLILVVFAALLVGRAIIVGAWRAVHHRVPGANLPPTWYTVISFAGIRGAIPIVLALSLLTTPTRLSNDVVQSIVAAVFGVAFLSITVGNLVEGAYVRGRFRGGGRPPPDVPAG
ncbi:MAG TPA: sodium:proton antiporter [Thermoplasmata archaeon]|nr:sodium:proton antiporter [Thermoplasmata archaeon]